MRDIFAGPCRLRPHEQTLRRYTAYNMCYFIWAQDLKVQSAAQQVSQLRHCLDCEVHTSAGLSKALLLAIIPERTTIALSRFPAWPGKVQVNTRCAGIGLSCGRGTASRGASEA